MIKSASYASLGENLFKLWQIWTLALFVMFVIFVLLKGYFHFLFVLIAPCVIVFVLLMCKIVTITRIDQQLICETMMQSTTISEVLNVRTWWSYHFGTSSTEISGEFSGKMRSHSNKIKVFMEVQGRDGSVVIYEIIQMSSKFPNHHRYLVDFEIDGLPQYQVWSVDRCIEQLELQSFIDQSTMQT